MEQRRHDGDHVALPRAALDDDGLRGDRARAMAGEHALGPAGGAAGIGHAEGIVLDDVHAGWRIGMAREELRPGSVAVRNLLPILNVWRSRGSCGAAAATFSAKASSYSSISTSALSRTYSSSSAEYSTDTLTSTHPLRAAPKKAVTYSGRLRLRIATFAPLLKPERAQTVRHLVGLRIELAIRHPLVLPDHGGLRRKALRRAAQHVTCEHGALLRPCRG